MKQTQEKKRSEPRKFHSLSHSHTPQNKIDTSIRNNNLTMVNEHNNKQPKLEIVINKQRTNSNKNLNDSAISV